jgi:hypothetical protein
MDTYYKEKQRSLIITSKEIDLEVNAERTKCMVMSRDQNVGQNNNIELGSKCFERCNSLNIWEQS